MKHEAKAKTKASKKSAAPVKGLKNAHYSEAPAGKGPRKSDDPTKGLKDSLKAKQVALLALQAASLT